MPFPFSFEDRIEVRLDSPEKAGHVAEGIRQWLEKQRARDMHWEGGSLHFRGIPPFEPAWHLRKALYGVDGATVQFQNLPDKVIIEYGIRLQCGGAVIPLALLLVMTAVESVGHPLAIFLFLPIALLAGTAVSYLAWIGRRHDFKTRFQVAALRGLSDGAEREYEALRSR